MRVDSDADNTERLSNKLSPGLTILTKHHRLCEQRYRQHTSADSNTVTVRRELIALAAFQTS